MYTERNSRINRKTDYDRSTRNTSDFFGGEVWFNFCPVRILQFTSLFMKYFTGVVRSNSMQNYHNIRVFWKVILFHYAHL